MLSVSYLVVMGVGGKKKLKSQKRKKTLRTVSLL